MKATPLVITTMICATIIFVSGSRTTVEANQDQDPVGRYQIAAYGYGIQGNNNNADTEQDRAWVIDTKSGETWYYTGRTWRSAGSPD